MPTGRYAHWEGFIKNSSLHYAKFVSNQGYKYRELKTCFIVMGAKSYLARSLEAKKAKSNNDAVEFLLSEMDSTANLALSSAIYTESKLGSKAFENILCSLDLPSSIYEPRYHFI